MPPDSRIVEMMARAIVAESRKPGVGISNPKALARAALAALEAAGYVVVPREPTEKMMEGFYGDRHDLASREDMRENWDMAIAAAKEPT